MPLGLFFSDANFTYFLIKNKHKFFWKYWLVCNAVEFQLLMSDCLRKVLLAR